jgi:hypothetical protein
LILIVLALALLREGLLDPAGDLAIASGPLIEKGLILGAGLTVLGTIFWLIQKLFGTKPKSRCRECRRAVPKGDIYCRIHLRQIIFEEDDRERRA